MVGKWRGKGTPGISESYPIVAIVFMTESKGIDNFVQSSLLLAGNTKARQKSMFRRKVQNASFNSHQYLIVVLVIFFLLQYMGEY